MGEFYCPLAGLRFGLTLSLLKRPQWLLHSCVVTCVEWKGLITAMERMPLDFMADLLKLLQAQIAHGHQPPQIITVTQCMRNT